MPRRPHATWTPRPIQSGLLRLFILLTPLAVGLAVTLSLSRAFPRPPGLAAAAWWAGISLAALVALFVAERAVRRLSPLAVLLKLSLAFPDGAPSRLAVAKKAGNLRRLKDELERARSEGREDDLTRAAENILALAAALSAHDRRTRGHSERVRVFTDMLAAELRVPEPERQRLRWAALLHDIGKLRVPAKVLNKEASLNRREWDLIYRHPEEGVTIAGPLIPWLGAAGDAIRQHHERVDGTGYPDRIPGTRITLGARIVSVADAYDTITAGRPYQKPLGVGAAREELALHAGTQFDPHVVRALLNLSIRRLWWRVGLMSWLSQIPLLGRLPRAAQELQAVLQSSGFASRTAAALTAAGLAAAPIAQAMGHGVHGPGPTRMGVRRAVAIDQESFPDPDAGRPGSARRGTHHGRPNAQVAPSGAAPAGTVAGDDADPPGGAGSPGAGKGDQGPSGGSSGGQPSEDPPAPEAQEAGGDGKDLVEQVVDVVQQLVDTATDAAQDATGAPTP